MSTSRDTELDLPDPPGASPIARYWARRIVTPIEAFLRVEAASGLVLLFGAATAMLIANSPWSNAYHAWVELPFGFMLGDFVFRRSIHFWIDDGLMTIFFFIVGLEVRRELHEGELGTVRRAALPFAAALGGMIAPAVLYLAVAGAQRETRPGWGIVTPTDIAFAVGVLAILGKRVPAVLRVLLFALAIIDDIGSILLIAIFYTSGIDPLGFLIIGGGTLAILLLQRFGARRAMIYLAPGIVVWFGFLRSGVHPSIAGAFLGMLTPVRPWLGPSGLVQLARRSAEQIERELAAGMPGHIAPERLAEELSYIEIARREALSPAIRLERVLHPWVAFVVMPLFAFVNAGLSLTEWTLPHPRIPLGIVVGLVVGKPLGILLACVIAVRTRIAFLPSGIGWRELAVLGLVAGIGFSMALFVAALAFPSNAELEAAKLGVLVASALALVLGLGAGRLLLHAPVSPSSVREE